MDIRNWSLHSTGDLVKIDMERNTAKSSDGVKTIDSGNGYTETGSYYSERSRENSQESAPNQQQSS